MAKPMVAEDYFVTKGKIKNLTEENRKFKKENQKLIEANQELKEKIKTLEAYNEQMQNENNCLGERADEYKEWYGVAKERVMRLEAKIEAYKEILRSVLKENK